MSDFDGTTVLIQDLQGGRAHDALAEADVVIAVDAATGQEEVVFGREEWQRAVDVGQGEELEFLRVELDAESDDLDWLLDAIDAIVEGPVDEAGELFEQGEEDLDE